MAHISNDNDLSFAHKSRCPLIYGTWKSPGLAIKLSSFVIFCDIRPRNIWHDVEALLHKFTNDNVDKDILYSTDVYIHILQFACF